MYGPDLIERPDFDAGLTEEVKLGILSGVARDTARTRAGQDPRTSG